MVSQKTWYPWTAKNSTNNNIGCLNIHGTPVTANKSTNNNIGCLNVHGIHGLLIPQVKIIWGVLIYMGPMGC